MIVTAEPLLSTMNFITDDLTLEIMFFMIIISGCYLMTSPTFPSKKKLAVKMDAFTKVPQEKKSPRKIEKSVVEEIKERGSNPSWFQSMMNPKLVLDMWERATSVSDADLQTFSILVNAYIRLDRSHMVLALMDQMTGLNVSRDKDFFESTIRQLASKRCFGYALAVLNIMEEEMPDSIGPTSYACAVNFCAQIGDATNGARYFALLEERETASLRAYMVILRLLNKVGDWKLTLSIIKGIKEKKAIVDGFVLNQALATLVNAEQVEHVRDILFDEFFSDIRTLISFNLYLKALSRGGTTANFKTAMKLLDYLDSCEQLKPNHISYNTVMDFAVKSHLERAPWEIVERMEKANVSHDEYTISIMVRSLSMRPNLEKLTVVMRSLKRLGNVNATKIDLERVANVMLDQAQRMDDGRKISADILQFAQSHNLRVKSRRRH